MRSSTEAAERTPGDVVVYFDASGGMRGYVAQDQNVLGNLSTITRNFVQSGLYDRGNQGSVTFRRFGEYRFDGSNPAAPPAVADPRTFARPGVYTDDRTNITDLLGWIRHERVNIGNQALSLVVTDLMLDDDQAVDEFAVSVGGALRSMVIEQNLALGFLALRVPFNGNVFINDTAIRANVRDRPLVVMMIGDPYQVREFYNYLDTTGVDEFSTSAPESSRGFALFGLEAGSIELFEPSLTGGLVGFSAIPPTINIPGTGGMPALTYDADQAMSDAAGGLVFNLQANAGVADFEVIGNEPLYQGDVWRLEPDNFDDEGCSNGAAWSSVGQLPGGGWTANGQDITYTMTPEQMQRAGLDTPGVYMVQIVAGQQGVIEDHPAADWMTEWSMSNRQIAARLGRNTSVSRVGIPGLGQLRDVLLAELLMEGRERIMRSASYAIIEVK